MALRANRQPPWGLVRLCINARPVAPTLRISTSDSQGQVFRTTAAKGLFAHRNRRGRTIKHAIILDNSKPRRGEVDIQARNQPLCQQHVRRPVPLPLWSSLGPTCRNASRVARQAGLPAPPRFLRFSSRPKSSELARTYRDDAYVVRETVALAAQLRAIAEGDAAPQRDDQPPPIGLDPSRGGGRGRL